MSTSLQGGYCPHCGAWALDWDWGGLESECPHCHEEVYRDEPCKGNTDHHKKEMKR